MKGTIEDLDDKEFVEYVDIHSRTDRALFAVAHIKRFLQLADAGRDMVEKVRGYTGYLPMHFYDIKPLIENARKRLNKKAIELANQDKPKILPFPNSGVSARVAGYANVGVAYSPGMVHFQIIENCTANARLDVDRAEKLLLSIVDAIERATDRDEVADETRRSRQAGMLLGMAITTAMIDGCTMEQFLDMVEESWLAKR